MTWQPFHFSGLLGCGQCQTQGQWQAIKASYTRHWPQRDLLDSRKEPNTDSFGIAPRFTGETLREWAARNQVNL